MSNVDTKSKTKTTSAKAKAPEATKEAPKEATKEAPKETKKVTKAAAPKEAAPKEAVAPKKETAKKETAKKEAPKKDSGKKEAPKKEGAKKSKKVATETAEPPKTSKKSKRKADAAESESSKSGPKVDYPEPPITKRSSYAFFTKERRAHYDAANPDASFGEKTRMVAKEWNAMSAAAKKPYETLADKDVKRYQAERAQWDEAVQKLGGNPKAILRARRELKKQRKFPKLKEPKRPRNAYVMFTVDKRAELGEKTRNKTMSFKDIATFLSDEWKKVSDADKAKYEKMAEEDKVRYAKDMEKFAADHPEVEKASTKKRKVKVEGEPTRPRNGYIFYCEENRDKLKAEKPGMVPKELMTELGKMWGKLSEVEKNKYKELAEKDKVRYEKDKSAWETKTTGVTA